MLVERPRARLSAEDLSIFDAAEDGIIIDRAETSTAPAVVSLTRLYFANVVRGLRASSVDLTAREISIDDARHVGLDLRQHGEAPSTAILEDLWIRGTGENALRFGGTEGDKPGLTVFGEDWEIVLEEGNGQDGAAIEVLERVSLQLDHASVEAPRRRVLDVKCGWGRVYDLVGRFGQLAGVLAQPADTLTLERVSLKGSDGDGLRGQLFGSCPPARTILKDVTLEGCETCSTGVAVPAGQRIEATRVWIQGFVEGVHLPASSRLSLSDSVLVDNETGLSLPAGYDLLEVLRGVSMSNPRNVELR